MRHNLYSSNMYITIFLRDVITILTNIGLKKSNVQSMTTEVDNFALTFFE